MKYNDNGTYEDIVIKAVAPGRNSYSSSQQEVYSCNYVNGIDTKVNNITGTLLWTNSNPSSDFGGQTLNLNLTDYDIIEIYYKCFKDSANITSSRYINGQSGWLNSTFILSDTVIRMGGRKFTVSNTGIVFENGRQMTSFSAATGSASVCVPVYIVGYKTGITFN